MFTINNFVSGLNKIFPRHTIEIEHGNLLLKYDTLISSENETSLDEKILCKFSNDEINEILEIINNKKMDDFTLIDNFSLECAIKSQDGNRYHFVRCSDEGTFSICEHGYALNISKASKEYIFALICVISDLNTVDIDFFFTLRHRITRGFNVETFQEFCDSFSLHTVKITSQASCTHTEFNRLLNSYLFNIAYNNNIFLINMDFCESRQPRRTRIQRNGQLFPYKAYKNDLIKYYNQASTAGMPLTKYLAYYHVAEFFFQTIAESDAFDTIESIITHPSFSPRNKESIKNFYNKIKQIMRNQKEDGVWEEKNGLLLCLKKYVPDLQRLKNNIDSIDINAVNYYQNNSIPFASEETDNINNDKVKINFNDTEDAIYATIRNRVYLVRNAIAHSKEGAKLRYEPFKHDKDLQKEIPLIRAISEEIIINSAKDIDLKE